MASISIPAPEPSQQAAIIEGLTPQESLPTPGHTYYAVCGEWYAAWKAYTGAGGSQAASGGAPGNDSRNDSEIDSRNDSKHDSGTDVRHVGGVSAPAPPANPGPIDNTRIADANRPGALLRGVVSAH